MKVMFCPFSGIPRLTFQIERGRTIRHLDLIARLGQFLFPISSMVSTPRLGRGVCNVLCRYAHLCPVPKVCSNGITVNSSAWHYMSQNTKDLVIVQLRDYIAQLPASDLEWWGRYLWHGAHYGYRPRAIWAIQKLPSLSLCEQTAWLIRWAGSPRITSQGISWWHDHSHPWLEQCWLVPRILGINFMHLMTGLPESERLREDTTAERRLYTRRNSCT